jgi:hypothetical protein
VQDVGVDGAAGWQGGAAVPGGAVAGQRRDERRDLSARRPEVVSWLAPAGGAGPGGRLGV